MLDQLRMRRASALPGLLPTSQAGEDQPTTRPSSITSSRSNSASFSPTLLGLHASSNKRLYTSQPLAHRGSPTSLLSRTKRRSSNECCPSDRIRGDGRDLGSVTLAEMRARQAGHRKRRSHGVCEPDSKLGFPDEAPDVAESEKDASLLGVISEGASE